MARLAHVTPRVACCHAKGPAPAPSRGSVLLAQLDHVAIGITDETRHAVAQALRPLGDLDSRSSERRDGFFDRVHSPRNVSPAGVFLRDVHQHVGGPIGFGRIHNQIDLHAVAVSKHDHRFVGIRVTELEPELLVECDCTLSIADAGADTFLIVDNDPNQTILLAGIGTSAAVTQEDFVL